MILLESCGRCILFLAKVLRLIRARHFNLHLVFEQIWKITLQSFWTTGTAGFFVGAIMVVQFTMQMQDFGALAYLGGLATSGTIREVGPLLIAFMLAGKIGAFTSAEIGSMRVTEQIDAIRCLGADPFEEIIVPRFLAIITASFFLLGLGLIMSIFGGMLVGNLFAQISPEEYLRHIPTVVTVPSIVGGLIKCFLFACLLATVCTFMGYHTEGGTRGVGKAVVQTAVVSMIGIVAIDWLTSFIWDAVLASLVGVL